MLYLANKRLHSTITQLNSSAYKRIRGKRNNISATVVQGVSHDLPSWMKGDDDNLKLSVWGNETKTKVVYCIAWTLGSLNE